MQKLTLKRRISIGVLSTILLVGGTFLFEQMTKVQGSQNGKLIPVVQYDKIAAYVDAGTIKQLNIQERALRKNKSNINDQNEASLDFVLGSAGIVNYHNVRVYGVGDEDGNSLSSKEIDNKVLSANEDSTMAMLNKAGGNGVILPKVSKILVEN